jgi:hypothetical protein
MVCADVNPTNIRLNQDIPEFAHKDWASYTLSIKTIRTFSCAIIPEESKWSVLFSKKTVIKVFWVSNCVQNYILKFHISFEIIVYFLV